MNDEQMVMLRQAHEAVDAAATAMYGAGGRRIGGELDAAMVRVAEAHATVDRVVGAVGGAGQSQVAEQSRQRPAAEPATESAEELRSLLDALKAESDRRPTAAIAQVDAECEALERSALQTSEVNRSAGEASAALIAEAEQVSAAGPVEKPKKRNGKRKAAEKTGG